jgi:hypothetical protein
MPRVCGVQINYLSSQMATRYTHKCDLKCVPQATETVSLFTFTREMKWKTIEPPKRVELANFMWSFRRGALVTDYALFRNEGYICRHICGIQGAEQPHEVSEYVRETWACGGHLSFVKGNVHFEKLELSAIPEIHDTGSEEQIAIAFP